MYPAPAPERESLMPAVVPTSDEPAARGRVLFIGASYYNNWYLSRELRALGWVADTFVNGGEGAAAFLHGTDYYLSDIRDFPKPDSADPVFTKLLLHVQAVTRDYLRAVQDRTAP